ncbi:MAG: hypothetical protein ABI379_12625 [Rhodanobacter sp.]
MTRSTRAGSPWLGPAAVPGAQSAGPGVGEALLALCMIGLGVRGLVYGDFAGGWQRIPIAHLPATGSFAFATAVVELFTGLGLLIRRTEAIASMVLVMFLLLWALLLKTAAVVVVPSMEGTWLGLAEITVILAGGWTVMALRRNSSDTSSTAARDLRPARLLFALSLVPIGLAHFFYPAQTVSLMPPWLPWHLGFAYITGAASLIAAAAVLLGLLPRLATTLEAVMLSMITLIIWLPGLVAVPGNGSWTPFLMSSAIACGAWAVADGYRAPGSSRPDAPFADP